MYENLVIAAFVIAVIAFITSMYVGFKGMMELNKSRRVMDDPVRYVTKTISKTKFYTTEEEGQEKQVTKSVDNCESPGDKIPPMGGGLPPQ